MKRSVLMALCIMLCASLAIGGTMAYLKDTASNVNVMTLGNVAIEQFELERIDGTGAAADSTENFTEFAQAKPLVPAVREDENGNLPTSEQQLPYGGSMPMWSAEDNAVDKLVYVKNTGKTDAYVRTLIAFEGADLEMLHVATHPFWGEGVEVGTIEVEGATYTVVAYVYQGAEGTNGLLKAGEVTLPSLTQMYLCSTAEYADIVEMDSNGNGTYEVIVLSQAVQATGFKAELDANGNVVKSVADVALDTAFGAMTAEKAAEWFTGLNPVKSVSTLAELQAALNAAEDGDVVMMLNDIAGDVTVTQKKGVHVTIDGNGNTFAGAIVVDGKSARYATAGVTIKNVNFEAEAISKDAYINLGNGNNATRYTSNVTVDNCTFSGDGKVAVKSYTGGDHNLTVNACVVNAGMHSLAQVTNVEKGLTITNCEVYSKNGVNLNSTPSMVMEGCTFDIQGYAVRVGVNNTTNSGSFKVLNSTLKSSFDDPTDALIMFRGNVDAATMDLTGTVLEADDAHQIKGASASTTIIK